MGVAPGRVCWPEVLATCVSVPLPVVCGSGDERGGVGPPCTSRRSCCMNCAFIVSVEEARMSRNPPHCYCLPVVHRCRRLAVAPAWLLYHLHCLDPSPNLKGFLVCGGIVSTSEAHCRIVS